MKEYLSSSGDETTPPLFSQQEEPKVKETTPPQVSPQEGTLS